MPDTYMGPHPDRIEMLAQALESGRFKQGHRQLTQILPDGTELDCCLGVACKIANEHGLEITADIKRFRRGKTLVLGVSYDNSVSSLSETIQAWYGFASDIGDFDVGGSLTTLNDSERRTFPEIAHVLRTTPSLYITPEQYAGEIR